MQSARPARLFAIATPCRVRVKCGSRYSSMPLSNWGALSRYCVSTNGSLPAGEAQCQSSSP